MRSLELPPKKTLRDEMVEIPDVSERDKYPYGTRIDLNEDAMELLGLDADDFGVDENIKIVAKAKVCSTSKREHVDIKGNTKTRQSVEFQLTHIDIQQIDSKSVRELMQMIK